MDQSVRFPTRVGNWVGFHLLNLLKRLAGTWAQGRPADYLIDLKNLYRMQAHWALTFAELGSIHLPHAELRELAHYLDTRSYLRVLRKSRKVVGPGTVRVIEADGESPVEGRSIQVSDHYYGPSDHEDVAFYPYVMHPWVYAFGHHHRLAKPRRTPRRFRLFFSGVVNPGYADRFVFPMMSRPAIIECLVDQFRSDACVVASRAELATLRRTDRPIVLILFRGTITPMASNHFLPRPAYFRLLARSRFALCPPGVFMPHSHNLIEAMAVGTIPLTNYPTYCRPELSDGTTCLAFTNPTDLCQAVERILTTPIAEFDSMKAAVSRHYDQELSPEGFARKLAGWLSDPRPEYPLRLNREFSTARLWTRDNPTMESVRKPTSPKQKKLDAP